jgi:hypothetical protein
MRLNPDDPVVSDAVFGEEVRNFLNSRVGSYIISAAKMDAEVAMSDFARVDPTKPEAIMEIQVRLRAANMVSVWLADAINRGQQAVEQLREDV